MATKVSEQISARWTHMLMHAEGFTPIPSFFLHSYHALEPKMTHAEAMFIIHLASFKWTAAAPFPSLATIAQQMGVSPQAVRAYVRSLEKKRYLRREARKGQSNKFHLDQLFEALERLYTTGFVGAAIFGGSGSAHEPTEEDDIPFGSAA